MLRFRLRTLLIAVAVRAVPMAWVSYSLRWIEQRQASGMLWPDYWVDPPPDHIERLNAPGGLWLFGEYGRRVVFAHPGDSAKMAEQFPEARIIEETNLRPIWPPD
jgi:hypothetical protein